MNRAYSVFLVVLMTVMLFVGFGPTLGLALMVLAGASDIRNALRKA